mgnify:CR=1 FL=1
MRILFIGDVVGKAGRTAIADHLPGLIRDWQLDCTIINGENAAGGFGITEAIYNDFIDAGADAVTLGNHSWDQREALVFIERQPRLLRPANYPAGTPGRGANLFVAKNGARVLVINVMGRVFLEPLDDLRRSIGLLADRGVDGYVLQILDPSETDLPFTGRTRFEGMEREGNALIGRVEGVREDYRTTLAEHQQGLKDIARVSGWNYGLHVTDRPAEEALLRLFVSLGIPREHANG